MKKNTKRSKKSLKQGKEPLPNISDESDVDVSFEAYNLSELDYHSTRQYLLYTFGPTQHNVDVSALATLITEDAADFVGTSMKQVEEGESGDAFAIISLIPMIDKFMWWQSGKWEDVIKGLRRFLGNKLREDVFSDDSKRIGLVLHERLVNMPEEVAAPMYQQLWDDWMEAIKEDATLWDVDHILLITPTYKEAAPKVTDSEESEEEEEQPRQARRLAKRAKQEEIHDKVNYYYKESECLDSIQRLHSWDFKVASTHTTTDSRRVFGRLGSEPGRRAVLMTKEEFKKFIDLTLQQK